MERVGILHTLIAAKKEEIERYKQLLKNQSAASSERADVLERMQYRMSRATDELAELQGLLELVEKYTDEH